jgi:hypothetical protein
VNREGEGGQAEGSALGADFEHGIASALDPANAGVVRGGQAVTTLLSRWLHLRCPSCGHTFRPGDEVDVSADGTVRHQSALLPCAGGGTAESIASAASSEFFRGLDEAWPPPEDMPVVRLERGHPLLAPPLAAFRRHACVICGHTLRLYDSVILCPCSPWEPICSVAIHRDPLHGLHCWEAWRLEDERRHCPVTSRLIDR